MRFLTIVYQLPRGGDLITLDDIATNAVRHEDVDSEALFTQLKLELEATAVDITSLLMDTTAQNNFQVPILRGMAIRTAADLQCALTWMDGDGFQFGHDKIFQLIFRHQKEHDELADDVERRSREQPGRPRRRERQLSYTVAG